MFTFVLKVSISILLIFATNHINLLSQLFFQFVKFFHFSSHKIYGPQGIGGLFIKKRKDIKITPLLSGGGQENGLRPGTLPTALCVGFGYAVELAEKERIKNQIK